MTQQPAFSAYGAVDLGALAARSSAPTGAAAGGAGAAAGGPAGAVLDVTEATFQADVLEQSMTVPVVVDFGTRRAPQSTQLTDLLTRLAADYGGRFVLARVDVDTQQRLASAVGVQQLPTVLGVVRGQALPLFAGPLPEDQARRYLDEMLQVAAANGVTGRADVGEVPEGEAEPEPPHDPRFDDAYDAIERGDLDAAAAAYEALLATNPADADARAGLAQVDLLRRTAGVSDPAATRAAADAAPDDVDAALLAADVDLLDNLVEQAFSRLVDVVRRSAGDDRDRARLRLLELFEVVGGDDPRVVKARAALTSALF